MKTDRNKQSVIVGIFILVGLAIFIVAIFALGGQKKSFTKKIQVKAVFDDVNGLQAGDNVWFSGVKVGTVKSVDLTGNAQVELVLNIDEKSKDYIKQDANVKISSDGFIGNKIVVIFGGTKGGPSVKEDAYLQPIKIASTEDMFTTLQANNENLLAITKNFKALSDKIVAGEGSVGTLLTKDDLANELRATMANFKVASYQSQQAIANISSLAKELNKPGNSVHDLASDTIITNSLRGSVTQLRSATYTADEFVTNLRNASDQLNMAAAQLNDPNSPLGALLTDSSTADDLKQTISNLQFGSQKLDEDLEALQHNFLFRGFFRKKEKEAKKAEQ